MQQCRAHNIPTIGKWETTHGKAHFPDAGNKSTSSKKLVQQPAAMRGSETVAQKELQGHQIDLGTQKVELGTMQTGIEVNRKIYKELYDFAPVGNLTLDKSGNVLEINLTGAAWLKTRRIGIIGHPLSKFMDASNRRSFKLYLSELFKADHSISIELQLIPPGGVAREVLLVSMMVKGGDEPVVAHMIVFDISERKAADKRLKAMSFELAMAEERERRNLAQDLHDNLGQLIAVIRIKLSALNKNNHDGTRSLPLQEIDTLLARASRLIQSLAFQLSPPMLDDLGLIPALQWLAGEMKSLYGLEVQVHDDGQSKPLDHQANITLFRAVRELLINVAKHADVAMAELTIHRVGHDVQVEVSDAGKGFDHGALVAGLHSVGFGLLNIKERIGQLGGTVEFVTNPGDGTRVTMTFPTTGREIDRREKHDRRRIPL